MGGLESIWLSKVDTQTFIIKKIKTTREKSEESTRNYYFLERANKRKECVTLLLSDPVKGK